MDQIINVLITVTLIEMMVTVGLGVSFADVVGICRNLRLVVGDVKNDQKDNPADSDTLLIRAVHDNACFSLLISVSS
jgi:hypothetical protein